MDALVEGLRWFFAALRVGDGRLSAAGQALIEEAPILEKYMRRSRAADDYATSTEVMKSDPGTAEALPHVIVSLVSSQEVPMSIGPRHVSLVQAMPRLVTGPEPFALGGDVTLVLRTHPPSRWRLGLPEVVSALELRASRFRDVDAVTAVELATEISRLGLYVQGAPVRLPAPTPGAARPLGVEIKLGGQAHESTPNFVELDRETPPAVRTALGLVGVEGRLLRLTPAGGRRLVAEVQLDDGTAPTVASFAGRRLHTFGAPTGWRNDGAWTIAGAELAGAVTRLTVEPDLGMAGVPTARPEGLSEETPSARFFSGPRDDHMNPRRRPARRYATRDEVALRVEVATEDDTTRNELADLVRVFVTFFWGQSFYHFTGRGHTGDSNSPRELWDLALSPPVRVSHTSTERPGADGKVSKVHFGTLDLSATLMQYVDRTVSAPGSDDAWFVVPADFVETDDLASPA